MIKFNELKHVALRGHGYFCIVKQYIDERSGDVFALKSLKPAHYPNEEY